MVPPLWYAMPAGETFAIPTVPLSGCVVSTTRPKLFAMLRVFAVATFEKVVAPMTVPLAAANWSYQPRLTLVSCAPVARCVKPPPLAGHVPLTAIAPAQTTISFAAVVVRPGQVTFLLFCVWLAAVCWIGEAACVSTPLYAV